MPHSPGCKQLITSTPVTLHESLSLCFNFLEYFLKSVLLLSLVSSVWEPRSIGCLVVADRENIPFKFTLNLFPLLSLGRKFYCEEEMVFTFKSSHWIADGIGRRGNIHTGKVVIKKPHWTFYRNIIYPDTKSKVLKRGTFLPLLGFQRKYSDFWVK